VHDESQVRLVEAHAQRAGRHDGLEPVGQQSILGGDPLVRVILPAVRGDGQALLAQERRRLVRAATVSV